MSCCLQSPSTWCGRTSCGNWALAASAPGRKADGDPARRRRIQHHLLQPYWRHLMADIEHFDAFVLGSGQGGQLIAWHLAQAGKRTALVERRWIGGSCPNIACMPSKTEIWSARVAHLAERGGQFGVLTGHVTTDMGTVFRRKGDMVGC